MDRPDRLPPRRPRRGQWIARVEAGRHDEKVAYLAVSAYRSGNHAPLFWRTADLGRTWTSVVGRPPEGRAGRRDPRGPEEPRPPLRRDGVRPLRDPRPRRAPGSKLGDLPTVPVDDIAIHERDRDLVVATHGRSLYVVDDVTALQELTPEVRAKALHLFPPRPAEARHLLPGWADWNGQAQFRGENPKDGALLTFWVKEATGEPVKVSIAGADGRPVANLTAPGIPGLGRVSWDLKPTKDLLTEYGGLPAGRHVAPGDYRVTVTYGEAKSTQTLTVTAAEGVETR